ncbi:hypothetical protein NFK08_17300 [Enterobacter roggenkampii]|uniref:hypothetical protein n=1 Tax=Enterobacter roggenkampii TaxID=1812935 RepID=UPI00242EA3A8|nr:hypothetical protein [Enterobacter roggenkampii]WFX57491.1 hypothetical protein NFK08_17300 [Enterobacter roggenkampii]
MDSKIIKEKKVESHLNSLLEIVIADPLLNPPFEIKGDIISDFNVRCTRYLDLIAAYKNKNTDGTPNFEELINKTSVIQNGIQSSLESFLSGDIKSAYDLFDKTFSDNSTIHHIHRITESLSVFCNDNKPLFRVRRSEKSLTSRNEIFHIPFSSRQFVDAQRYSVAGLPCLYLGTSLYVCWQEMDKPDFDKLFISSFTTQDTDSKILNFASPFMILPSVVETNDENRIEINRVKASYMIFWPLIMACNYTKKDNSAKFIQEYIIPNLLMQWISRKTYSTIVGVAYYSTKIPKSRTSYRSINVVFPPKTTYEQTIKHNFCPKLSSLFSLTPPVSWQVLKTLDHTAITEDSQELLELRLSKNTLKIKEKKEGINNFEEDLIKLYPLTDFYKLEKSIDMLFQYQTIESLAI